MVTEAEGVGKGGTVQNFKLVPGGVHGSTGEVLGAGSKPSRIARGMKFLDQPRRGSMPNLASVKRVPRTQLVPGTVVWAHVPFEDGQGEKVRPAVVVERCGRDLVVFPGTTSASRWNHPSLYVEVRDLGAARLARPTGIRTRSVTIDVMEVLDIVGQLGEADRSAVLGLSPQGHIYPFIASQSSHAFGSTWTSRHSGSGDAA